jgi:hypothetical protein
MAQTVKFQNLQAINPYFTSIFSLIYGTFFGVEPHPLYSLRIEIRQTEALEDSPVVFHETMPLGEGIWAAPISSLWGNE